MGGKSAPPPPDYAAAARETAAGNLELAKKTAADNLALAELQTKANRINQYTPYGSLEYTYGKTFDQAGYDAALKKQQEALADWNRKLDSGELKKFAAGPFGWTSDIRARDARGNIVERPREISKSAFESSEPIWQQTMKLTPQAQATLDAQMAMDKQYADIAQAGLGKARGLLENPNLDFSKLPELQGIDLGALPQATKNLDFSNLPQLQGIDLNTLPQAPINAGQTAQQAIMSRLQPTLQQRENELAQRLANQGITLGSEAYQREMNLAGQNRNDLELQAAREGITLDQAARINALNEQNLRYGNQADMRGRSLQEQLAGINLDREARINALNEQNLRYGNQADMRGRLLQEQAMQKDRPLNLINALRSGAQVQNPTFQPYAMQSGVQQANVAGADLLGAAKSQYQAEVDRVNAQNAGTAGLLGGIAGIGMGLAGLPMAGGGSVGGNFMKKNLPGLFG